MSKGIALLRRAVGGTVSRVLIEVLFHSVERLGSIAGIAIELQEGRTFFLGCAGDGGIFALSSRKDKIGLAPGYMRIERPIDKLGGLLSEVQPNETSLVLTIGGHQLEVRNDDDELVLILDHDPLGKEALIR